MRHHWILVQVGLLTTLACGHPVVERTTQPSCDADPIQAPLVINEVMSNNEGAWLDDQLETEDYVELVNVSDVEVTLSDFEIGHVRERRTALPDLVLPPEARVVLFADDAPGQGELHLPLKFSSRGETLQLWRRGECQRIDRVRFPPMGENEVFARYPDSTGAFQICRYASPERSNGENCEPSQGKPELEDISFAAFPWPERWPEPDSPLDLNEVALPLDGDVGFVEIVNTTEASLDFADYSIELGPQPPGTPWPARSEGFELPAPDDRTLEPGEFVTLPLEATVLEELGLTAADDMVVSVFERASGNPVTRLDFMAFPEGKALARPAANQPHVFCETPSPGRDNDCELVERRDVPSRLRYLRTAGDFEALARGGTSLASAAVKVVVDLEAGGVVHLLSSEAWDLHYTFSREILLGEPHLDRCDPAQRVEYDAGWWDYSAVNYFQVEGRRFYGATLVQYAGSQHQTLEFAVGDVISGEQMREAFFMIATHTLEPRAWVVRPQAADQVERIRSVEGTLPLVGPNAPFSEVSFQPLTIATGYGVLDFVAAEDLATARLGPDVIVVTDDVPNDIPLVGGLITEAFQTPLSHVNVLSQNRGTPNMALSHAREDEGVRPYLGQLVRLTVQPSGFEVQPTSAEEANAFWESRRPQGEPFVPRLDLGPSDLIPLDTQSIDSLPFVGGKAAQFAELYAVSANLHGCGEFRVPPHAFAVPFSHFWKHAEDSGARAEYLAALDDDGFQADYRERRLILEGIQALVLDHPVDTALMNALNEAVESRYGTRRIRLRSSSNAEDLPDFNGAGLYTSEGITLGDSDSSLEQALKSVWASLYSPRAHDERQLANIDHREVAMAVLVHEAYPSERARGVAVSRNLLDPVRSDVDYINAQAGEATVTNPAPGITTEQILYERFRDPPMISYRSRSNLIDEDVLEPEEMQQLSCALYFVEQHYSRLLDPNAADPYFAVEVEFKFLGAHRELLIKQARKHPIVSNDMPPSCRMF